jgi:hypothetical protein
MEASTVTNQKKVQIQPTASSMMLFFSFFFEFTRADSRTLSGQEHNSK